MTHATYDSYKESGVPWLGKVPAGWEVKRLRFLLSEPLKYGANESAEFEDRTNPRYIRITDVNEDGSLREETFKSLPEEVAAPYMLDDGDILLARSGATVGKTFIYRVSWGRAAYAGYLIRARINKKANADFIYLFLNSKAYWDWLNSVFIQSTIQNVNAEKYSNLLISIPPLTEQKAIVEFLDTKMAQIDSLIAKKKNLLKLLAEQRTALITNTVTRGLDKSAPMKESGITWLGKVPNHWEVVKITHGFNLVGSGTTPRSDNVDYYNGDVPWVTTAELKENVIYDTHKKLTAKAITDHTTLPLYDKGALLIAMYAGITIGSLGILGLSATVNQACCVFDKPKSFDTKFVFWWLQMAKPVLISEARGGAQANLSQDALKQLRVPCPKIPEQKSIADFLDCKTAEIDATKDRITTAIGTLKEYRTALITNAVTGKIDVRHTAK